MYRCALMSRLGQHRRLRFTNRFTEQAGYLPRQGDVLSQSGRFDFQKLVSCSRGGGQGSESGRGGESRWCEHRRIRNPLGAGSCTRCVDDERDSILEALLTRCVYYRDFQPVAADAQIGG